MLRVAADTHDMPSADEHAQLPAKDMQGKTKRSLLVTLRQQHDAKQMATQLVKMARC